MRIFFLLGVCATLLSCAEKSTPKNVVVKYLSAIDGFEFEKANAYLVQNTENTKQLDEMKNYVNNLAEDKKQALIEKEKKRIYNIIEKEIGENEANVMVTNNEGSYTTVITFQLIRENGNWKIKKYNADIG